MSLYVSSVNLEMYIKLGSNLREALFHQWCLWSKLTFDSQSVSIVGVTLVAIARVKSSQGTQIFPLSPHSWQMFNNLFYEINEHQNAYFLLFTSWYVLKFADPGRSQDALTHSVG